MRWFYAVWAVCAALSIAASAGVVFLLWQAGLWLMANT